MSENGSTNSQHLVLFGATPVSNVFTQCQYDTCTHARVQQCRETENVKS